MPQNYSMIPAANRTIISHLNDISQLCVFCTVLFFNGLSKTIDQRQERQAEGLEASYAE